MCHWQTWLEETDKFWINQRICYDQWWSFCLTSSGKYMGKVDKNGSLAVLCKNKTTEKQKEKGKNNDLEGDNGLVNQQEHSDFVDGVWKEWHNLMSCVKRPKWIDKHIHDLMRIFSKQQNRNIKWYNIWSGGTAYFSPERLL